MSGRIDVAILGAGSTGLALALALANASYRVVLIGSDPTQNAASGRRYFALSLASRRILSGLGVWPLIAGHCAPIEHIHVGEAARIAAVRVHAAHCGVTALGHVVLERVLTEALADRVRQSGVRWMQTTARCWRPAG